MLGGLYRHRSGRRIEVPQITCPEDYLFQILLVISRPKGDRDIPSGAVSRPLIEALRPLGSCIKLEVLRPPTFEALVEKLNEISGYYNLVHFDCHGSFEHGNSNVNLIRYGVMKNHGCLIFERGDESHCVNSQDLG